MYPLIQEIRKELQSKQNEEIRQSTMKFFKEEICAYGMRNGDVEKLAKQYKQQVIQYSKTEIFEMCEELWKSNYIEEAFVACHFTSYIQKRIQVSDIQIFSQWIDMYITNWATCDTFCNHTIGDLIMNFPETIQIVKSWAHSPHMWKRRAAAVSCIIPARRGLYKQHMIDIATILLHDPQDMVQKGYGWLLKETSKPYCIDVFEFVMQHKQTMPRTALRYAIEKMPQDLRKTAMER